MRASNRLSALTVSRTTSPGRYCDGAGLYLQIAKGGSKSWLFQFEREGRERQMGLGPLKVVSLADAREKAQACRRLLVEGIDPIEARRASRQARLAAEAKRVTFRQAAERYIDAQSSGWKNGKHRRQWPSSLEAYVYPKIGELDVAMVDVDQVLRCLEPIWRRKPETASRVRGRIEAVLDWAAARKLRSGENPARWKGHLDTLLAPRAKVARVKHHTALPWSEIPAFVTALRSAKGIAPRALEFLILTAARTGEVIEARWPEIDLAAKTWTLPAERMKAGREHRVPLSAPAIALVKGLPREGDDGFVFIGASRGRPLSNMAMLQVLRRLPSDNLLWPTLTAHGFRSTFRDWAAETTSSPNHVVEMALAHAVGDKVEAAYRRGDLFQKRRRLMEEWARYSARSAEGSASAVVPLQRERKR